MYQSLEHDEVVIIEIRNDVIQNASKTIRVSLSDGYSQWAQEILTATIKTGGENVSSKHIKGQWQQADTLSLCLFDIDNYQRAVIVNVADRTHTIKPDSCPL